MTNEEIQRATTDAYQEASQHGGTCDIRAVTALQALATLRLAIYVERIALVLEEQYK